MTAEQSKKAKTNSWQGGSARIGLLAGKQEKRGKMLLMLGERKGKEEGGTVRLPASKSHGEKS